MTRPRRGVSFLLSAALSRRRRRRMPASVPKSASLRLEAGGESLFGRLACCGGLVPGGSAVHALDDPLDAFAARVLTARAAQQSLDVQVYLWHDDATGRLLLEEAREAAHRGVRVRLLIDDNAVPALDPVLAMLDALPSLEVRLFNPTVSRGWRRWVAWLREFSRLHRRMHNKAWIVDGRLAIVGGRNIGDAYFASTGQVAFADLDLIAVGQVAGEVGDSFDRYWNSPHAWPASALLRAVSPLDPARFAATVASDRNDPLAAACLQATSRSNLLGDLAAGALAWERVPVQLLADDPAKVVTAPEAVGQGLLPSLRGAFGDPRRTLDLVSPYFVPGAHGLELLGSLVARGVRVRVLTNSLAATDVPAVHGGYARWRSALLRAGVELYELRPDARRRRRRVGRLRDRLRDRLRVPSSLHAKTFAVDGERIFVGSFNLDPRSVALNTEMGLVVDSPSLARRLGRALDDIHPHIAWRVVLDANGSLRWDGEGAWSSTREPAAPLGRRIVARLMAWLRVDWLL